MLKIRILAYLLSFSAIAGCGGGGGDTTEANTTLDLPAVISSLPIIGAGENGEVLIAGIACSNCLPSSFEFSWSIGGEIISSMYGYRLTTHDYNKEIRLNVSVNNEAGLPDTAYKIIVPSQLEYTEIYSTSRSFSAITTEGNVIAWGHGMYGGDTGSANLNGVDKILTSDYAFIALKVDGSAVIWGSDNRTLEFNDIVEVYSTMESVAILKANGTALTWNKQNDLDIEYRDITDIYTTINAFAALKNDGTVITWGQGAVDSDASAIELADIEKVYSTELTFVALKKDGTVITWNGDISNESDIVILDLNNVTDIYTKEYGFVAIKDDGSAAVWDSGQLIDNITGTEIPNNAQIYTTSQAFAALKTDGTVQTWSWNFAPPSWDDIDHSLDWVKGRDNTELNNITEIHTTYGAFAALKTDGTVVPWGYDLFGGDNKNMDELKDIDKIVSAEYVFAALKADGSVVTWGDDWAGDNSWGDTRPLAQTFHNNVAKIVAIDNGFAALKNDGSVVSWGYEKDLYFGPHYIPQIKLKIVTIETDLSP